jgi:hypothetical protein
MPISLTELSTELMTDPTGLGYAPLIAIGNPGELASAGRLDATRSALRNLVTALFPSGSATRTNLEANRPARRESCGTALGHGHHGVHGSSDGRVGGVRVI